MNKNSKIFIAGRRGLVGSSIERELKKQGYDNIVGLGSKEVDLKNQIATEQFFFQERPEYVILAAAKVGGILANIQSPAEFLYDNLMIQSNVIHNAYIYGVKKMLFLASSCIYPRLASQPMKEEYLLDGKLEPTNEGYAIAKIAGLKMCEMYNSQYNTNFIGVIPCNIFGIGDNFDSKYSHVVAGLIRKFHEAKIAAYPFIEVWGTGNVRRELMFNDDLAEACVFLLNTYSGNNFLNIGTGYDISIKDLSYLITDVTKYKGEIRFDPTKPEGMPQKLLDISKLKSLGWDCKLTLKTSIEKTYEWYLKEKSL